MFEIPVGQIESFIFDFDRDVYGKTLRVRPVRRLRGEAKFESVDQLVNQMGRDTEQARAVLAAR
jgi:riboflavin kinase/FMN adenylyltransferase